VVVHTVKLSGRYYSPHARHLHFSVDWTWIDYNDFLEISPQVYPRKLEIPVINSNPALKPASWDISRLPFAIAWELESKNPPLWLVEIFMTSLKDYTKLRAAVKWTVKLQGVLRWKYFLFGIKENSPEPQNTNGKCARWLMDSIDSGESDFYRQPAVVFGQKTRVIVKVISRMRRRDKRCYE